jgi:hypothetical protein
MARTAPATASLWRHQGRREEAPTAFVACLLAAVSGAFDLLLAAAVRAEKTRARFMTSFTDERRSRVAVSAATSAAAVLLVVCVHAAGPAGLLAVAVPIVAVQAAFRRLAAVRASTLLTARGLPRALEVAGYVAADHVRRVSELAVAVGQNLAMTERELTELEYAALMHDIGHAMQDQPVPGGATILSAPREQLRIAACGAEMIRKTGKLDGVADIVHRQYDPPSPGQPGTPEPAGPHARTAPRSPAGSSRSSTPRRPVRPAAWARQRAPS